MKYECHKMKCQTKYEQNNSSENEILSEIWLSRNEMSNEIWTKQILTFAIKSFMKIEVLHENENILRHRFHQIESNINRFFKFSKFTNAKHIVIAILCSKTDYTTDVSLKIYDMRCATNEWNRIDMYHKIKSQNIACFSMCLNTIERNQSQIRCICFRSHSKYLN